MKVGLGLAFALVASAVSTQVAAEAPVESLVPAMRPEVEAPEAPPARPEPEGVAQAEAPRLGVAPARGLAPAPSRDFLPAVPRDAPLFADGPPEPVLEGPSGVVRAELLFEGVPPRLVGVDRWAGDAPPVRPGTGRPVEVGPAPGRPRVRPGAPLLPPEPDGPLVYAPDDRPDILPVGPQYSVWAVAVAVLPAGRPEGLAERAEARAEEAEAEAVRTVSARGQLCGIAGIDGEVLAPVRGSGGCGIEEPVLVRSVGGVRLLTPATIDCTTAAALLEWVEEGAAPAVGGRGGGLVGLEIAGSYACRPRNNQPGARLSEHGRGRAVDVSAVVMADGSRLVIARDWPDEALREMHRAACGIFSTTLGPGSDGYHEDHLHYDTARGRGPYCR